MKSKNNEGQSALKAKVALLHTTQEKIIRALADTRLIVLGSESFVEGTLIAPEAMQFDNGKRILINLRHVITFTAFESVNEIYKDRKAGQLRAIRVINSKNKN